jgi:hypothetical protein
MTDWEIIADDLKKPVEIAPVSQVRITMGDHLGLSFPSRLDRERIAERARRRRHADSDR